MKLTLSKKLFGGYLIVLVILAVTIAISYTRIAAINNEYGNLLSDKVKKMILIQELASAVKQEQLDIRGYLATGNYSSIQNFSNSHDNYLKLSKTLKDIVDLPKANVLLQELEKLETKFNQIANQEAQYRDQGKTEMNLRLIEGTGSEVILAFDKKVKELTTLHQNLLDEGYKKTIASIHSIKTWVLILGALAVLIGLGVAVYLGRIVSRPVVTISNAAKEIASGNLTIPEITVKNQDEIGELATSFNLMSRNLRELIYQVGSNAQHLAASAEKLTSSAEETSLATEQIASSMQGVASGIDEQFKTIEESASSINEMATGVREIAQNTLIVSDKAMEAHHRASGGVDAIQTAIGQMSSIHQTVGELASIITKLGERSTEIGQFVKIITEIATQTNLLALNASIEAARAGEHGRGFSIVVAEVRKLAEQSSLSAKQVSPLIASIQDETQRAIHSMNNATKEVATGIEVVNTAEDSFESIQESVHVVSSQIQEITSSVQQMAAGTDQLVHAMNLITEVSENTVSSSQEAAASAEEQEATMREISTSANDLSRMAEQLQTAIGRFTL